MGTQKLSCLIVAGGEAGEPDLSVLCRQKPFVIAADSGYTTAKRLGIAVDLLVGDFDSSAFPEDYRGEAIRTPAEKDDTDTMLAVRLALARGFTDITILGGLGGRLDHTMANIQTLAYLLEHGAAGRIFTQDCEVRLLCAGEYQFPRRAGFTLSVFAYGGALEGVTLRGVKYPLKNARITDGFPIGISNEITADYAGISFLSGKMLVIQANNEEQFF